MDLSLLSSQMIAEIELVGLAVNLLFAVFAALALSFVVARFSNVLTDTEQYAKLFLVLIPTMVLIISVVKSSLALSLGLVGALSIVRFRTPIKDPEELGYIFLAIAVGLGLGANQTLATALAFVVILALMMISGRWRRHRQPRGVYLDLTIDTAEPKDEVLAKLYQAFDSLDGRTELRRVHKENNALSATFFIKSDLTTDVGATLKKINNIYPEATLTFIDQSRH